MISLKDKIFLAGHNGLVGSTIYKSLKKRGYKKILTISRSKLDLLDQNKTYNFLKKNKPKIVIIAAAKVGGIKANNQFKADFISENLTIQNNLILGSFKNNIKNLIFLGSSCVYPIDCKRPIKEEYLLTGKLEETNEPYAVAKIAGIKLCESLNHQYGTNYLCIMPTNTYGPGDNYDLNTSHFIPALLKKIYLAKSSNKKFINLWGTGKPKRELIYVEDLASAVLYFMKKKTKHTLINIGTSEELTIKKIAKLILKSLSIKLEIKFDGNKNFDGVKSKVLDVSLAKSYGWKPMIDIEKGVQLTFKDLKNKIKNNEI